MTVKTTTVKRHFKRLQTVYGGLVADPATGHSHIQPVTVFKQTNVIFNADAVCYTNSVDSVSGGYVTKIRNVRWKPRYKVNMRPPIKPVFHPPQLKPLRWSNPPFRPQRKGEPTVKYLHRKAQYETRQQARFKTVLERYEEYRLSVVGKRKAYLAKYEILLAKYNKRAANFSKHMSWLLNGIPVKRPILGSERPWHPYSRTRVIDAGLRTALTLDYYGSPVGICSHGWPQSVSVPGSRSFLYMRIKDTGTYPMDAAFSSDLANSTVTARDAKLLERLQSRSLSTLPGKLSDEKMHIGNFLAERAQTANLLADVVKSIASVLKAKKSVLKFLGDSLASPKQIADATLAFQFGVRPLLSDAHDLGEGLAKALDMSDTIRIRLAPVTDTEEWSETSYANDGTTEITKTWKITKTCRYSLDYSVDNAVLRELGQWGLINPAEIAWEMMPWTFVIDWLVPVGSWIESWSADAGLKFVRGCYVTKTTTVFSYQEVHNGDLRPNGVRGYGRASGSWSKEVKSRVLCSEPFLATTTEHFRNPFSFNHLVDAIALLVQKRS